MFKMFGKVLSDISVSEIQDESKSRRKMRNSKVNEISLFAQSNIKTRKTEKQQKVCYLRIPFQCLQKQTAIYEWRKMLKHNIIPITSYEILSPSTSYLRNPLFKVSLQVYKKNLNTISKLCISQIITLTKQILVAVNLLFKEFGYHKLTEKMIVFDEQEQIKVWLCENHETNPSNPIYVKQEDKKTEKQVLKGLLDILKNKCIETRRSKQLFNFLYRQSTFEELSSAIISYEKINKLILPTSICPLSVQNFTMSTANLTILSSSPFDKESELNSPTSLKLRKFSNKYERRVELQKRFYEPTSPVKIFNMTKTRSGFYSIHPEEKKQKPKLRLRKINSTSGNQPDVNRKLSLKSCVLEEQIKGQNVCKKSQRKSIMAFKTNIENKQQKGNDSFDHSKEIIEKNGWSQHLSNLPFKSRSILKESFSEGIEEEVLNADFNLKKLHTMGRDLTQSFLPVEEEFSEDL